MDRLDLVPVTEEQFDLMLMDVKKLLDETDGGQKIGTLLLHLQKMRFEHNLRQAILVGGTFGLLLIAMEMLSNGEHLLAGIAFVLVSLGTAFWTLENMENNRIGRFQYAILENLEDQTESVHEES